MRKIFWTMVFLGGYFWLVTSGHDHFVLNQGKMLYRAVVEWFDDAEVDFQLKKEKIKKRSRRWN